MPNHSVVAHNDFFPFPGLLQHLFHLIIWPLVGYCLIFPNKSYQFVNTHQEFVFISQQPLEGGTIIILTVQNEEAEVQKVSLSFQSQNREVIQPGFKPRSLCGFSGAFSLFLCSKKWETEGDTGA